jgi:hypothetical protein
MTMRNLLVAIVLCATIAGCTRKVETAPAQMETRAAGAGSYMAYEHSVALDVDDTRVVSTHDAIATACQRAVADGCLILESHVTTGRDVYASIKLRARSEGIKKIIAGLDSLGTIVRQSTIAEDLSKPIADAKKRLEMLTDYRSRLESLRARASTDVDALIKVNKELAQVQSELETETAAQSNLKLRIDTEILNISIASNLEKSFWHPIGSALKDFTSNLSDGISSAVTAMAYILPWSILLIACGWLSAKLWSGWKRRRARA